MDQSVKYPQVWLDMPLIGMVPAGLHILVFST